MKRILIFFIISFFLTNAYSSPKFDKDLKKFSKDNGFIDSKGKIYSENAIKDKKNSILIIYNHGSDNDQKSDKCTSSGNNVPKVIRDLHDKNIKNFKIKIYRLCTGAKGWSKKEQTKMWKAHEKTGKLAIELKDKDGISLINKQKQNQRLFLEKKQKSLIINMQMRNI